jgi:hypothetical protein
LLWSFWRRGLGTIWPGWLPTTVLPISASQVSMITGMSHRCLAQQSINQTVVGTMGPPCHIPYLSQYPL